ncbi:MAG: ATP phosphoribosyltransferase regulatory subunit [Hyphomonadaceae bacterium]|nr:ATP phosphoribosyltransferase regulatory subunit [Hyphomonadaceae bacterium]
MSLDPVRLALRQAIDAHAPVWLDPPVLQPAALYLELSGEDIRRRAYLILDDDGELCLRPDMTIPALRAAFAQKKTSGVVAYEGLVFRRQSATTRESEFTQIGAEWLGPSDDAAILGCALDACRAAGATPALRVGDLALVAAFVDGSGLHPHWAERVKRALKRPHGFDALEAEIANDAPVARGALADALAAAPDPEAALADLLSAAHIVPVGGRSLGDVARRLSARAEAQRAAKPTRAQIALLHELTHIDAPISKGLAAVEKLLPNVAKSARTALDAAAARFAGLPKDTRFTPGLGRNLAYYDGFVFELEAPALGERASLGGGGRYDALTQRLNGAASKSAPIRGAGFALRPARIELAAKP